MFFILENIIAELEKDFDCWDEIKENGCYYDPFYCDGVNLNYIRGYIIEGKKKVKIYCEEKKIPLPEIYYRETPPEVDNNYMAKPDKIRKNAKRTLEVYEDDLNYKKLKEVIGVKEYKKRRKLKNVLGYVSNLRRAIEEDDLVYMRIHDRPKVYLKAFKSMLEEIDEEEFKGQLSIFGIEREV